MSRKFRPSLIPTLAAGLAIAATVSLGNWQRARADEKLAVQAQLQARETLPPLSLMGRESDADALAFRRVVLRGSFEPARQIFLDNKSQDGKVGVHLVTPFRLQHTGSVVLVNRGWMLRPRNYPNMPDVTAPQGQVVISGLVVPPLKRFLELSEQTAQGALWQNLTIERAAQHFGESVFPLIVLADTASDGLVPVSERPAVGIEKHQGYAFQWYALATLVVALWIGLNFRKMDTA